jgi:hypothetical protein
MLREPFFRHFDAFPGVTDGIGCMHADLPAAFAGKIVEVFLDHLYEFSARSVCVNPVGARDASIPFGVFGQYLKAGKAAGENEQAVNNRISILGEQISPYEYYLRMGGRM